MCILQEAIKKRTGHPVFKQGQGSKNSLETVNFQSSHRVFNLMHKEKVVAKVMDEDVGSADKCMQGPKVFWAYSKRQ